MQLYLTSLGFDWGYLLCSIPPFQAPVCIKSSYCCHSGPSILEYLWFPSIVLSAPFHREAAKRKQLSCQQQLPLKGANEALKRAQ